MHPNPSEPLLTKADLLRLAEDWYDPNRVAIDGQAAREFRWAPEHPRRQVLPSLGDRELRSIAARSLSFNSLNYQFWDLQDGRFTRYAHCGTVGAMGLRRAFDQAWGDPESALAQACMGQSLSCSDIVALFGDLPNPESRAAILNEVLGSGRLRELVDQVVHAVQVEARLDVPLAHRVAQAFPLAYGDPVLKKAQLALSEVWVETQVHGFSVVGDLTAFADYQIPNVLRAMGVLQYHPDLARRIGDMTPIPRGSADERALRGASILAVEQMAQVLGQPVAAVDHFIWSRRKEASTPFHLTFTTAY